MQPNWRAAPPSADNLLPEDEFESANHSGNLRAIALVVGNPRTVGVHFGRRRILSTGECHAERDGLCRIHRDDQTLTGKLLRDRTAESGSRFGGRGRGFPGLSVTPASPYPATLFA